jgi:hypothetical protein
LRRITISFGADIIFAYSSRTLTMRVHALKHCGGTAIINEGGLPCRSFEPPYRLSKIQIVELSALS